MEQNRRIFLLKQYFRDKVRICVLRFKEKILAVLTPVFTVIDRVKESLLFLEPYYNIAKKYGPLVSFSSVFLLDMYVLRQYETVYGDNAPWTSPIFIILKQFHNFYFTGWNFAMQIFFLVIAISDEIALLTEYDEDIEDYLNGIRSYCFSAIVFPCSLLVSITFWTLYLYNRQLVFPKEIDEFYPIWMNHAVHSAILIPLITEILAPKKANFITIESALFGLTCYLFVYQTLYLSAYFFYGVWLYPVFFYMTWIQKMLFLWIEYALTVSFLTLGIYLQNLKKTVF